MVRTRFEGNVRGRDVANSSLGIEVDRAERTSPAEPVASLT